MELLSIYQMAEICAQKGITYAVISPGSRNAPLTIAFVRHPMIKCYSIPDERSAAFVALGISLKAKLPTALICTSGTAALNYAPAVAEAYFNQVPLLILTADRPPEWINQRDGQTIHQEGIYGTHIKQHFSFPSLENDSWYQQRMLNEAINLTQSLPAGPVHLNIPFRVPFHPKANKQPSLPANDIKIIPYTQPIGLLTNDFRKWSDKLMPYKRLMIVVGQGHREELLTQVLSDLSQKHKIVVVVDIISNQQEVKGGIVYQDLFLKNYPTSHLAPDLLITFGLSVISKHLKNYLRQHKNRSHWHIAPYHELVDSFQSLSEVIIAPLIDCLRMLKANLHVTEEQKNYYTDWQNINCKTSRQVKKYHPIAFSEIGCYQYIMHHLPNHLDLHLANSMAVRYANVVGLKSTKGIEVYCNRGTSGIDGSNSTAVGTAIASSRATLLITGDVAFLYDRNAFWHNHVPQQLKIIVFNNHGGGIFRMLKNLSDLPELDHFFETKQQKTAEFVAQENGFKYLTCDNQTQLIERWTQLWNTKNKPVILEIFTNAKTNTTTYKALFRAIAE